MIFIYGNYGIYELNYLSALEIDYHFLTNLKSDNEETRNTWKIWNISIRFFKDVNDILFAEIPCRPSSLV